MLCCCKTLFSLSSCSLCPCFEHLACSPEFLCGLRLALSRCLPNSGLRCSYPSTFGSSFGLVFLECDSSLFLLLIDTSKCSLCNAHALILNVNHPRLHPFLCSNVLFMYLAKHLPFCCRSTYLLFLLPPVLPSQLFQCLYAHFFAWHWSGYPPEISCGGEHCKLQFRRLLFSFTQGVLR